MYKKIYKIINKSGYQYLMHEPIKNFILSDLFNPEFKGKLDRLPILQWYFDDTSKKQGDFFNMTNQGILAFNKDVYDSRLLTVLEMSGDIYPINISEDSDPVYLLNVTEQINALDTEKSKFHIYNDGSRGRIIDYSFRIQRLNESSIFKIPDESKTSIFTYSGLKDDDDEFYSLYHKLGFSGLSFEEVYTEE